MKTKPFLSTRLLFLNYTFIVPLLVFRILEW